MNVIQSIDTTPPIRFISIIDVQFISPASVQFIDGKLFVAPPRAVSPDVQVITSGRIIDLPSK